jgi:hypothetical protein
MSIELLFSYGTLQLESIQLANFGRTLQGRTDSLPRFVAAPLPIEDPAIVEELGQTHYTIAQYTGIDTDEIRGTVYELTSDELEKADAYELPEYQRVPVILASGTRCWVYADVEHLPPQS